MRYPSVNLSVLALPNRGCGMHSFMYQATIFISYRRDDSADACGRLFEHLEALYGRGHVLQDVESLAPGVDFREEIERLIGRSDVLLAVIGPYWSGPTETPGLSRIKRSDDFVRIEIEQALRQDMPIIPVLVADAKMPKASDLPRTIRGLADRNALPVRSGRDFRRDIARLIQAIEQHSRPRRARTELSPVPKTLAIASSQGGVGKTTTAVNLAASLAHQGHHTLLVDLDPRSNATIYCGAEPLNGETAVLDWLCGTGTATCDLLRSEIRPHLALLPAGGELYATETQLAELGHPEFKLWQVIESFAQSYEFIVIDCPSSIGLLTRNALVAADGVILPMQPDYFSIQNMQQLLRAIAGIRASNNPWLGLFGILVTMYGTASYLTREVMRELHDHYGRETFHTVIPRTAELAEAPVYGQTALEYAPETLGVTAYEALAREVFSRAQVWKATTALS